MRSVEYVTAFFAGILACAMTSARERWPLCAPPGTVAGVDAVREGAAAAVRDEHATARTAVNLAEEAGGIIVGEEHRPMVWRARTVRRAANATRAMCIIVPCAAK
jgi:hypothetical protein